jgi:hypothetical protein
MAAMSNSGLAGISMGRRPYGQVVRSTDGTGRFTGLTRMNDDMQ